MLGYKAAGKFELFYKEYILSDIVIFVWLSRTANLFEIKGVNIRMFVHQVVALLSFYLHSSKLFALVLNYLCHLVAT